MITLNIWFSYITLVFHVLKKYEQFLSALIFSH